MDDKKMFGYPNRHIAAWGFLVVFVILIILIIVYAKKATTVTPATVSNIPVMTTYQSTRLPGAGYLSGSAADQFAGNNAYGYSSPTAATCSSDCLSQSGCQEYVYSSNGTCYLMNVQPSIPSTFSYNADNTWTSGVKSTSS
jgi:hypothetical protein